MVKALSPQKALKKYARASIKADMANRKAKKKYDTWKGKVSKLKKDIGKKGISKAEKSKLEGRLKKYNKTLTSYKSKYSKAKTAASKAEHNYKYSKHMPEVNKYHMQNTLKAMKKDRDWAHSDGNYLIPKNPWSNHSYVLFYITDFQPTHESSVNSTSVEHGFYVSSVGQMTPPSYSITGYIGGEPKDTMKDIKKSIDRIQTYADDTTQVLFTGDQSLKSAVVTSFAPDFNHQVDGGGGTNAVQFSMTITGVSFAESNVKKKKHETKDSGKKKPKKGSSKGSHYVIAKRGDTYWGIASKHKVSVSSVEKKNKYSATHIPVGAKIYY